MIIHANGQPVHISGRTIDGRSVPTVPEKGCQCPACLDARDDNATCAALELEAMGEEVAREYVNRYHSNGEK